MVLQGGPTCPPTLGSVAQVLAARYAPETKSIAHGVVRFHVTIVPATGLLTIKKSAPLLEHVSEDFYSFAEPGEFGGRERVEIFGERGDAQAASFLQQAFSFGRSADVHAAGVGRILRNIDQVTALEPGDDAAHGWQLYLLGGGEVGERFRSAENQYRECRKACRALSSGDILLADPAQQVDRGGMQAVGDRENLGGETGFRRMSGFFAGAC